MRNGRFLAREILEIFLIVIIFIQWEFALLSVIIIPERNEHISSVIYLYNVSFDVFWFTSSIWLLIKLFEISTSVHMWLQSLFDIYYPKSTMRKRGYFIASTLLSARKIQAIYSAFVSKQLQEECSIFELCCL